jgi:hypothetical protein
MATPPPPSEHYSPQELELLGQRDGIGGVPPPFSDRWVIYVDVEGFSRLIADPARRVQLAWRYWELASSLHWGSRHHRALEIAQWFGPNPSPSSAAMLGTGMVELWRSRVRIFSDSIFIFLNPRSGPPQLELPEYSIDGRFVPHAAAALSRALWEASLPHRGALAFGKCFIDSNLNVFLGEPIVAAHQWAQAQQAFGISVEPRSVTRALSDFQNEPFTTDVEIPSTHGLANTIAVNCTQGAMFGYREGLEVAEDRALDGLLKAASESKLPWRVRERYRVTAHLWLTNFASDTSLRRHEELASLARAPGDLWSAIRRFAGFAGTYLRP